MQNYNKVLKPPNILRIISKFDNKNQPASQQADCQTIKTDGVYKGFYAVAKVILIFEIPTKYFRFQQFINIEQKKSLSHREA